MSLPRESGRVLGEKSQDRIPGNRNISEGGRTSKGAAKGMAKGRDPRRAWCHGAPRRTRKRK